MSSVREQSITGFKWNAIGQASAKGVNFALGLLIARMLMPEDYCKKRSISTHPKRGYRPFFALCQMDISPWLLLLIGVSTALGLYGWFLHKDENMRECLQILRNTIHAK